jgi:hypothetical protein
MAFATAAACASAVLSPPLSGPWRTDVKSTTLELVDAVQDERATTFTLKNISGRHITALSVSHDEVTDGIDFFEVSSDLQPGASYSLLIGNVELSTSDRILRISAVFFADGSAEGASGELDFIRGRRLGRILETARVTSLLNSPIDLAAGDSALDSIVAKIGSLPGTVDQAVESLRETRLPEVSVETIRSFQGRFADGFLVGVRGARGDATGKVNGLRQLPVTAPPREMSRAGALEEMRQLYSVNGSRHRSLLRAPMTCGRTLIAVALTGWSCLQAQSCVPTQTSTENDDCLSGCSLGSSYTPANCPLCKSVAYRVVFPDGSPVQ